MGNLMVKARYTRGKVIHKLGFCLDCKLEFNVFSDGAYGYMKHIEDTGHSVVVETGVSNTFYKISKERQG